MQKKMLIALTAVLFSLTACERPADESPSKFQREANIKRYLQKAKDLNRLNQERAKELPIENPINPDRLTKQEADMNMDFLSDLITRNKQILEKRLLEAYGQKNSEQLKEMMTPYLLKAQQAAKEASTAEEMAQQIGEILAQQKTEIDAFLSEKKSSARLIPSQDLLDKSKERLQEKSKEFLDKIEQYYASETARQSQVVVNKSIEDYIYAMASEPTNKSLDEKIAQITQDNQEQLAQIAQENGDPFVVVPEETITSLRAEMITQHQKLEQYIEPLYGKDAVLQTRKVFNQLLQQGGMVLRENMRLSEKKKSLEFLNKQYSHKMLELQKQWNEEIGVAQDSAADKSSSK